MLVFGLRHLGSFGGWMNRTCLGLDERFVADGVAGSLPGGVAGSLPGGVAGSLPGGDAGSLPVKMKGRSVALSDHAAAELEDHVPQPIDLTPFDHLQRLEPIEGVIRFLEPIA